MGETASALGLAALAAGVLGAAGVRRRFRADLAAARARLAGPATVATRHGPIAHAAAGAGPPVLVLHGALGGFDQGLAIARPLADRGFRLVAPSRPGYPGTPLPPGATAAAEAEMFADLLDALGLGTVAVAGMSAGVLPALAFARAFPDRVRALVLLAPALRPPGAPPLLPWGPRRRRLSETVMATDTFGWLALRLARRWVLSALMASDPALYDRADPAERARVDALLDGLLPIAERRAGLLRDARAVEEPVAAAALPRQLPALILAAEDDRFGAAAAARWLAGAMPGARLALWPDGGHLGIGRAGAMAEAVAAFLRAAE